MAETEEDQQTPPKTIELHEVEEGELKQSSNYIFQQIGSPLRLNPNSSSFDLDNPPTQALAISHKPQSLLFLAHSKGFYVAKTVEVVTQAELAKKEGNNKSCCIEEFCVVDVQIDEVRSLAVSKDSSTLAVCVGAEVHFFSIASLLNKEQEPFLSRAIDDSSYVKDFQWRKKLENSFLVLGSDGRLYYGDLDSPLKEVMENVDAVEWSPEGNFVAVAKQDSLSIFSPRFRGQFTMSMPFSSVVTDADPECTIKVDSISWIREDCIILGCFQIVGDGEENGYLIQVVSCKEGSISEGSSALVIVSFNEVFVGIDDDTLPFGCGPHLFLNYLEHGNVAFLANKKSIDAHIQLFSWSLDAIQKEVVQVDLIQDDKYLPRILYQENEDDNMIMGFGVDTLSLREKDKVTLEVESKELSPYCILLCLTLDEKILMFYVADATVSDASRKIASPFSDGVEKTSAPTSFSCDSSDTSSRSMEQIVKETASDTQSVKIRRDELETDEGSLVLKGNESQTPDLNDNFKKSTPSPQPSISERESLRLDKSTLAYRSDSFSKDSIMLQKPVFSSSGVLVVSTGSMPSIFQSKPKDSLGSDEASKHESKNFQRDCHQSASLGSHSSHKLSSDSLVGNEASNLSSAPISFSCDSSDTSSRSMEHNVKETASDAQSLKTRRDELETDEGKLVLKGHESQTPDLNDNFKKSMPSPQPSISERESLRLDKSTLAYGSDSLSKDSIMRQKPVFSSSGVLGASTGSMPSIFQSKPKDPLGSDEASNLFSNNFQRDCHQSASLDSHSSHKLSSDSLGGNEASNLSSRNFQRDGLQSASSGSYSSHKLSSSNEFNSRLSSTEIKRVEQSGSRVQSTVNVAGNQSSSDPRFGNNLNTRESNSVPQFSTNVSGRSTLIGGHKSSAGATKFASEPGTRSSQVSPYGGSSSQNTLESKLQPPDEKVRSPQLSYGVTSEREFSKHFGNVNEMAKELDFLLSGIEKEGGFRDACIMFQEDSVLGIEQDLENLTKRCRVLKSMMEERFEGVHNLLDQTVQVLARKIYIEGIVKQTSDSQYWDLWDRQKLTPELELKRRQILKVNQNLTNQLIELERHFNTLELNKFGENNEIRTDRRVLQSISKSSRDGQAFHKLYNTMNSQLAAAEQLSECLTKQMAVLNIESPSAKRKSVAKELFESIGLSYDGDSFKSPNVKNAIHSPESVKKLSVSSARGAMKDQSRRNPSSVVKNFESETARRRVSLDRSWASFTPPKTTVKRMLLQEERPRMNADKSSLVANKESVKQFSPVAHLRDHKKISVPLPSYVNKDEATTSQLQAARDNEDKASKQVPFKWTKDLSGKSQLATMKSPALQVNQGSNLLSSSLPCETQNITNEIIDRPAIGRTRVNKFDQSSVQTIPYFNATPTLFAESSVNRNSATTSLAPNRTPQMSANMQSGLNHKDTQTKSISHAVNHREASQEIAVNAPVKSHEPELTLSASPAVVLGKGIFQNETVKKDTQLGSSPVNQILVSSLPETIKAPVLEIPTPLSILPSFTSSLSLVKSEDSFKTSTNAEIPSTSSFSSSSRSTSPISFSFQTGNQQFNPSISSATTNISSQVHSTDTKTTTPLMEPKPSVGQLSLKSDANASQASPLLSEPPSAAPASTAFVTTSAVTDVKNESSDLSATQEDEMEEEASDTTTDLNLGSLGGFGLGSAPTSAVPKSNLFGSTFQNTAATSSFNLTVPSGELFRPASFSIQPIQPSQPASQSAFSTLFTAPEPARSGFGQPAQIGSGQQALGSVLGSFGQSRQLGITPPGSGFTSTAGLGGGGFANTAPGFGGGGGFSGGFAAAAPVGGGFAGVGSGGGGGFAGAGSGGFGSFSNQQGGSAFSSFGGSSAGSGNPNPLFTQMRK